MPLVKQVASIEEVLKPSICALAPEEPGHGFEVLGQFVINEGKHQITAKVEVVLVGNGNVPIRGFKVVRSLAISI